MKKAIILLIAFLLGFFAMKGIIHGQTISTPISIKPTPITLQAKLVTSSFLKEIQPADINAMQLYLQYVQAKKQIEYLQKIIDDYEKRNL